VYKQFTSVPAGRIVHPVGHLLETHDLDDTEPSEGKMQFVCLTSATWALKWYVQLTSVL